MTSESGLHILRYKCAAPMMQSFPITHPFIENGTHSDQRIVADLRTMYNGTMSDRHEPPDMYRQMIIRADTCIICTFAALLR